MKPFRERNPVVIGAIGLTLVVGGVVAALRIDDLPLIGGGHTYKAAFHDASGLVPGNEVRVAGVKVGKVTDVGLASDNAGAYVRVTFRVTDGDVSLGKETGATIRIKTVLGQKYLALTPTGAGKLDSEIPLSRTASPFDVVQAVNGLAETFGQIDTKQLATAFDVLSQTFADTPPDVKASLDGLSKLSQTISGRDAQLRELLSHAHGVTTVLAQRDEEFRKLIVDGNKLLDEATRRRDAIHRLLVSTSDLAIQLSGLVADNKAKLAPALRQLGDVVTLLQRNKTNLERSMQAVVPFVQACANVVGNGRWFDSYVDGMVQGFTPGGQP